MPKQAAGSNRAARRTGGYRSRRTISLDFAGTELDVDDEGVGLEVRVRSISVGRMFELMLMSSEFKNRDLAEGEHAEFTPEQQAAIVELMNSFADALVSWNVEDEVPDETAEGGVRLVPVPCTRDAVRDQDFSFIFPLIMVWMDAIAGVEDDLGKGSTSGATLPEVSMPMVPLSVPLSN